MHYQTDDRQRAHEHVEVPGDGWLLKTSAIALAVDARAGAIVLM